MAEILNNKSLVSSANYLTDLDSTYSKHVTINKNNIHIPNGITHSVELTISIFNKHNLTDDVVVFNNTVNSNASIVSYLNSISSNIISCISDATVSSVASINSNQIGDVSYSLDCLSTDTVIKNINIKVSYGNIVKYDIKSVSNDYIKLFTNAGLLTKEELNRISMSIENIDSIVNVSENIDDVNNVSANILSINNVDLNILDIKNVSTNIDSVNTVDSNIDDVITVSDNIENVNTVGNNINNVNISGSNILNINKVSNNINSVNTVSTNINSVNNVSDNILDINSIALSVIPNMSEILLVDDKAIQVNNDKLTIEGYKNTVISDKNIVASDKTDIAAMKLAIETIYDTFDDRFLGAKTNDPIVDNDGNQLLDGAIYFNSSDNLLKVYNLDSTTWIPIPQLYLSALLDVSLTSITTGDMLTWNGTKWINTRTPKVDSLQLNGGAITEGIISWNSDDGTADLTLPGGSTLQIGQENVRTVRNATDSTISNGRLCMFDGTIGNSGRIKVKPFTAGFNEAMYLYGVATQNITPGSDGIITIEGKVRGIDTTGASVGEVWHDEDILYAKPNDNGMMTNVEPENNQLKLVVATVIHAHATNGCLEIRFMPFNENMYYTKIQNDILLNSKVPLSGDFTLDLGGL